MGTSFQLSVFIEILILMWYIIGVLSFCEFAKDCWVSDGYSININIIHFIMLRVESVIIVVIMKN
jgi:hypothetical protein